MQLRDLSCLALRLVAEQRSREAAGMVATLGWVRGLIQGPATGRAEPARLREVAWYELAAAEHLLADGRPVPPLHDLCQLLEVSYQAPLAVDAGYGIGVWLTLRWLLGEASRPPLNLPIRRPDGQLMGEVELYASLVEGCVDRVEARETATALAADSRRLAALIDDAADRIRR
jgi:hypothetical protein